MKLSDGKKLRGKKLVGKKFYVGCKLQQNWTFESFQILKFLFKNSREITHEAKRGK